VEVMTALGFARFGLAGHHRSGRVVYRLALDHPDRVQRLAVLDRCNSVHPGPIETAMLQEAWADPAIRAERLGRIPLGRIGTPDDIAYGVLYLASDESSFVTGAELVIDGGTTAQ
jgi:NAD(P)-dependent dehydrogenase (short-subunit alcohol dehydrogenase family)